MKTILTHLENNILTIQFNRPEKRNALTQEMYTLLNQALESAEQDEQCRVILLTGSKDYFTGGNDSELLAPKGAELLRSLP